jgi:peptidoglycan/LPS O-acetylase OafA/YrhL
MSKMYLVLGILFIVLAVIIFVFADGLRRWYSGIFFAIIGTVILVNALRKRRGRGQSIQPPPPN